ncbi:translocation/assembly module TamB [Flavobacterium sp. GT3R68]|uniref:translocation/assembly module TamB domain-containing protein n=1 Tax=Flavobacterium sp. GT3R68 TaxID=2594437 RepID=UPI000F87B763|nr:translocation/assembly module TamB [Flavobacterium sp. GT3R68]RTY93699.1 translocation/assembly module TamB [Flavobacterium sp. GSN2]TRW91579.1 translocation/assembly module TamB [Flavobacterium sp. GT3R68]
MKKHIKKSIRILLWILLSIVGLLLLLILLIQIPAVQNKIKDKAVTYLEDKIHTKVSIGYINVGFPKNVILENVYLESRQKDTLLYGEKLNINISLFQLLSNEVQINSIDLKGISAHISRDKDSVYNYAYIIKAFESKKEKKADSKPYTFSIKDINLDKINVRFDDAITKNDLKFYFEHFDTHIDKFDLDNTDFEIPKIKLDGLNLKLKQGELVQEIVQDTKAIADSLTIYTNLKLKLGEISLSNIKVGYDNIGTSLNSGLTLDKMIVRMNAFDIKKQLIDVESLEVEGMKGGLTIGKYKVIKPAPTSKTPDIAWKVKLNQADLKRINFRFDDENYVANKKGIDYKHLDVSNFNLDGEKFSYSSDAISGNIYALTIKENRGLDIQSLKTEFYYGEKSAHLKNLYLKTPQTLLKDEIILHYPSLESLRKNPGQLDIQASIKGSRIGFKDVMVFIPEWADQNPFKSYPNAVMTLNTRISGKMNNIQFPNLEVSGIGDTRIAASGKIIGLPDAEKAYFDLNIRNIESTAKDVTQLLPAHTVPNTIQLPSQFSVKGIFKGTLKDFFTNINLQSSYGAAKLKGDFDFRRPNRETYRGDAVLSSFDIGKLIKNKDIGKVTLSAKVNGTGFNPKTATAAVNGKIASAQYNKYTYRNATLNGTIKSGVYDLTMAVKDPNLAMDLASNGSFEDKYPAVKLKMNVDIADLEKLNLHAGPLKLKGQAEADFPTADPDYLNGNMSIHHLRIANENEEFALDTINIIATATSDKNTIDLNSQFLDANINGKYKLTQLADAIANSIAAYYDTHSSARKPKTAPQQLAFEVKIKKHPILMQLVPKLTDVEPILITGHYNSVNDTIILNGTIPKIVYNDNTITNAVVKVDTKDKALVYGVTVDNMRNSQIDLPYTSLSGAVQNNQLDYTLQLKDNKDKERYLIAGNLKASDKNTEMKLKEQLVLNYESWNMDPANTIRFGDQGMNANAVTLSKDKHVISIQSQSARPNAPMAIEFKDFKIETITGIIQKDSLLMGGRMNGNAVLKNLSKTIAFTADLEIADFNFKKDTIGNINLKVNNEIANIYKTNAVITGKGNQVNLDGIYRSDSNSFDMVLDMIKLNLKSIQGFAMGHLTQSTGFLSGRFKINGSFDKPRVNGDLQFNEIGFKVKDLNSYFKSMNDKIGINNNDIVFDNFTVSDEKNNLLLVDGNMTTTTFRDYGFNLRVNAENFRALNSKAQDNELYYGEVYLDTRLRIKGTLENPVVDGNVKIKEKSKLTVVLPQSDPEIVEREGIVEFIDQDNPEFNKKLIANDSLSRSDYRGMNVSVNITIDKEAELSMVIDKGNGDYLKLKGEAQLTGGIDPSGKTTLIGRYEFTEGTYEMTFNLLKRKFEIKEGSYILWTGEPTTADIKVMAVYKTEAAPIDLLNDQLPNESPEVRNPYKQKIPFETRLNMTGELLKPDITFDIVLPEGNNIVSTDIINKTQAKLTQLRQEPSELNKQVFALLLLNRFIGENPFASESGGNTVQSLARQSASKLLSEQLNNLASDLISGVELDFDLDSYESYTSGKLENKTDLNVGVSKRLLDDRLKVTIGSTFGLEGQQQVNQESNVIAGDISADYKLSKDGRYRLRAYRKNQYQMALQGQIVETGVAFIITMNYNKFSELFHRVKEGRAISKMKAKKASTKKP